MIYGLYQSAAGMMVNQYRQAVLANNLANADTVGFKRDVAALIERPPAWARRPDEVDPSLRPMTGGVWAARTHTDFSEGQLQRTDNPLDVALAGPGFLMIEGDNGPLLTRDGRLIVAADGTLVSATDGRAVLGRGGAPVRVSPRGGEVRIDEDGFVLQRGRVVGQLGISDVQDPRMLRKVGGGRFELLANPEQALIPASARVLSGYVERSTVEPVKTLTSMLEASRAYLLNAQMLTLQDQTAARLINVVASS